MGIVICQAISVGMLPSETSQYSTYRPQVLAAQAHFYFTSSSKPPHTGEASFLGLWERFAAEPLNFFYKALDGIKVTVNAQKANIGHVVVLLEESEGA